MRAQKVKMLSITDRVIMVVREGLCVRFMLVTVGLLR